MSFSPIDLYKSPNVLKNFFNGRPLILYHSLNSSKVGSIHDPELQTKMFEALGFTEEKAKEQFGHLITAFSYGAPPHGGLAYGLDRLCMLLAGLDSIRDVIAFPKVQNASDLMMNCPDVVDDKQLDDLSIAVTRVEEEPQA